MYQFVKDAVLKHADDVIADDRPPLIPSMIAALQDRKWHLYQRDDYSDQNHLAWLKTRYPQALDRELRQAITDFRIAQQVKR